MAPYFFYRLALVLPAQVVTPSLSREVSEIVHTFASRATGAMRPCTPEEEVSARSFFTPPDSASHEFYFCSDTGPDKGALLEGVHLLLQLHVPGLMDVSFKVIRQTVGLFAHEPHVILCNPSCVPVCVPVTPSPN